MKTRLQLKTPARKKPVATTGSQRELADFLGISVPTLTREIRSDPTFPIVAAGRPGVASVFDFAAVAAHRKHKLIRESAAPHVISIAERRAEATASLAEIKLREAQGLLIDREQVAVTLAGAYTRLGKFLERFPRQTGAELNWSGETVAIVRERLDDGRRQFVRDTAEFVDTIEPADERTASSRSML